ncbi:MAG TPA: translocation/assembly module TamB domain-containing protein [Candidatus Limnocylindrales bacterium]|nr:translocation/assembly module TamB domain-containing protein [Candidatus Limnocylindrales bacterium]
MRRRIVRVTRSAVLLAVLVAVMAGVLAAALVFSLRYSFIQQHVGHLVTRFAKKAGVFFVRAENVTGNLPWQLHVDRVEVGDKDDVYITIEDAEVSWHPLEVWQPGDDVPYRIVVDHVRARRVVWTRLPETIDEPDDKPFRWDRFPRILVEKLEVEQFEVGPDLLGGHRAVMKAHGRGVLGEWEQGRLDLTLQRIDGRRGSARIDLFTSGSPIELRGNVVASEEEGGALAHLARLPQAGAVELEVEASGAMRDWRARADVVATAIGKLGLDARIAFGPSGAFDGVAQLEAVEDIRRRALLPPGGPVSIAARGAWIPDQALRLDDVDVVADGRTLGAHGKLDLSTNSFVVDAVLGHEDPGATVVLRGIDVASARGHAEGRLGDAGELRAELDVSGAASGPAAAASLRARLLARDPAGEGAASFELTVDGEGLTVAERTAPLLGAGARATAAGTVDLDAGAVSASDFVLAGEALRIEGPIDVADDWGSVRGSLVARSADLSSLERLTDTPMQGAASLTAKLSVHESGAVQADIAGSAEQLRVDDEGWNALLGPRLTLEGRAAGNLSGPLQASADVRAEGVTASATASMAEHGGELRADLSAVIDNLARLSDPKVASVAGRVVVDARASGALEDFTLDASARGERIVFEGVRLDELTVDARGSGLPDRIAGSLDVHARYGELETRLRGDAAMPSADRLVLSQVSMTGPSTSASIDLDIDLARDVVSGRIVGSSAELALWRPFLGRGLGGSLAVDLTLAGAGTGAAAAQLVSGSVHAQNVAIAIDGEEALARAIDLTAEGVEIGPAPKGSLAATVADGRFGSTVLTQASITATGDGRAWDVSLAARGSAAGELSVDAAATIRGSDGRYEALVSRLDAHVADQPLQLTAPVAVEWSADTLRLPPAALRVGEQGRLLASLSRTPADVTGDADLHDVPLAIASAFVDGLDLDGTLSGSLDVRGKTWDSALAEAHLEGRQIGSGALQTRGVAPVNARVDGRFAGGRLTAKASLIGLSDTTFDVALDAPLTEAAAAGEAVEVALRWHGDIAEAASLLPLGEDVLRGRIDADLTVGGTTRSPQVHGTATMSGASYENGASGLVLRDIEVSLIGQGPSLLMPQMTASDGDDGRVTASGRLDFGELPAFALTADLTATDAMLTRLDLITTEADATIAVRASRASADADVGGSISGDVKVKEARVRIPNEFVEDVPELAVVEIHGAATGEAAEEEQTEAIIDLALAIDVVADNRIFVEGRALDSEWKADLDIRGTTGEPIVEGVVESVRGQLELLGRRFSFREGTLRFDGNPQNVPYLNMTAEAEAHDVTAIVDIRGNATRPTIELRSEPALPRDEVLSRVLFGESAGDLTPMQSVQLARSVAELTGSPLGGGSGILGRVGRSLGLDRLGLETGDAGGGALSATKYLTDDVYLRFQQGLTPEDSKAVVEWEIFNNVTIESDISQDAEGEIGLNWKWDY